MPRGCDNLAARCEMLIRVYGDDAVLVIPESEAGAVGLSPLAGNSQRTDVPLGSGFIVRTVDVPAKAALKLLRQV